MTEPALTRRERVIEILNKAAAGANADYHGHPNFWELAPEELQEVEIYGFRMVAPADHDCESAPLCPPEREVKAVQGGKCCSSTSAEAPPEEAEAGVKPGTAATPGRGAASGLVMGLRCQYPFDGSRFPRLPWGGTRVDADDIRFIEEWIDDGLPDDDLAVGVSFDEERAGEGVSSHEVFHIYSLPTGEYKYKSGELKQRVNLESLDSLQLEKLRHAHKELYRLNDFPLDKRNYNNQALIHQNHCQHAWERFLPWHRVYMYEFEQALQDFCPDVTLPYWDWPMPIYREGVYQIGEKGEYDTWGGQIPDAYRAFLTPQSIENLRKKYPGEDWTPLERIVCKLYTSQQLFFFAVAGQIGRRNAKKYRNDLIYELLQANPLWYPLRYPAEFWGDHVPTEDPPQVRANLTTINSMIHYHYPTAPEVAQIQSLSNYRDYGGGPIYNDSYGYMDQNPHNTLHIWSGGQNPDFNPDAEGAKRGVQVVRRYHTKSDLYSQPEYGDMFSNLTAAYDPIFWIHHINIDRLWSEWQVENPNAMPTDLETALSPWDYTVKDVLDIHKFGYEYVKGCYIFAVDEGSPVSRFVSGPAGVPGHVLKRHKKVEIRLHRVPQLPLSCYIRAFLNDTGADATSRVRDNPHYAGYAAVFGHGDCYGGPGHCDVPPLEPRRFDRRGRHMNTPRNYRIDATECVNGLVNDPEAPATDLRVTLVVVGVDGKEIPGLLRLAGVSLNFKD
jgi:tyrosinase